MTPTDAPAPTPAVERAERALVEAWHGTIGRAFHPTRIREARAALAAALDVEEMAEIVAVHTPDLVNLALDGFSDGQHLYCGECGVLDVDPADMTSAPRHVAEALRAAILGSDQ